MKKTIRPIRSFLILFLILYGLLIASVILPDREYSSTENKYLATLPSVSLKSVLNGSFAERYDTYVSDQLPGRDSWIALRSVSESFLLRTENNGVVYGEDGYLFQKYTSFVEEDLRDNIGAINCFSSKASAPVYVVIVPSSYTVLGDLLPEGAPFADQRSVMENGQTGKLGSLFSGCSYIDILSALDRHSDEYIYYRTDHHWTTDGAWLAYNVLCTHLGLDSFSRSSGKAYESEGFLGTSYSRCRRSGQIADIIKYYPFDAVLTEGGNTHDSIYDYTKLSTRDRYAMFLYGNGAERKIESAPGAGKKGSLLVIKDSFADCLIPFLTNNYETITCIDPRYWSGSFSSLAAEGYDDILILFGFEDLAGESSILKLGF
ncbi:MAG: hypothetical protein J5744_05505 [Oscillospiraceae bacterium]|nr:hypothetical protein [Oscillospiraceae bacterium]